jgi:hypothetical protein
MKFYIDENLPPNLARALDLLNNYDNDGTSVHSIKIEFGVGVKDEEWIPVVGKEKSVVITRDYNIHQTRQQKTLYEKHGVGIFFLRSPSKKKPYTYWEFVVELVSRWNEIKEKTRKDSLPFAYLITKRKIQKI